MKIPLSLMILTLSALIIAAISVQAVEVASPDAPSGSVSEAQDDLKMAAQLDAAETEEGEIAEDKVVYSSSCFASDEEMETSGYGAERGKMWFNTTTKHMRLTGAPDLALERRERHGFLEDARRFAEKKEG